MTALYRAMFGDQASWLRRVENPADIQPNTFDENAILVWSAKVFYLLFNEIGPTEVEIIFSQQGLMDKA